MTRTAGSSLSLNCTKRRRTDKEYNTLILEPPSLLGPKLNWKESPSLPPAQRWVGGRGPLPAQNKQQRHLPSFSPLPTLFIQSKQPLRWLLEVIQPAGESDQDDRCDSIFYQSLRYSFIFSVMFYCYSVKCWLFVLFVCKKNDSNIFQFVSVEVYVLVLIL